MYIGRRRNPFIHLLETRSVKKYSNVSFFKFGVKKAELREWSCKLIVVKKKKQTNKKKTEHRNKSITPFMISEPRGR